MLVVSGLGLILVDQTSDLCLLPRAVSGVVEGDKQLEVAEVVGCVEGKVELLVCVWPAVVDVERERVNLGFPGKFDVVFPVVLLELGSVSELR